MGEVIDLTYYLLATGAHAAGRAHLEEALSGEPKAETPPERAPVDPEAWGVRPTDLAAADRVRGASVSPEVMRHLAEEAERARTGEG